MSKKLQMKIILIMICALFILACVWDDTIKKDIAKTENVLESTFCDSIIFYYESGRFPQALALLNRNECAKSERIIYAHAMILCKTNFLLNNEAFFLGINLLDSLCSSGSEEICADLIYFDEANTQEKKIFLWTELADQSNVRAMYYLGKNLESDKQISWLEKSCHMGEVEACDRLMGFYRERELNDYYRIIAIGDSLGSINSSYHKSLLSLTQFSNTYASIDLQTFLSDMKRSEYSHYPKYIRFFEYGKILYLSSDVEMQKVGEMFISKISRLSFDAEDFMEEHGILVSDELSNVNIDAFDNILMEQLIRLVQK